MLLRVVLACGLAASLSGCGSFDFDIEEVTAEVVLDGDLQAFRDGVELPIDVMPSTSFEYDLDDTPNGIHVKDAVLSTTDTVPAAQSLAIPFSFINSVEFWVYGEEGSRLQPVRIAWLDSPGPGHNLNMNINDTVDLTPYVVEGFSVRGVLNGRVPASDVSFRARVVLAVDVF